MNAHRCFDFNGMDCGGGGAHERLVLSAARLRPSSGWDDAAKEVEKPKEKPKEKSKEKEKKRPAVDCADIGLSADGPEFDLRKKKK